MFPKSDIPTVSSMVFEIDLGEFNADQFHALATYFSSLAHFFARLAAERFKADEDNANGYTWQTAAIGRPHPTVPPPSSYRAIMTQAVAMTQKAVAGGADQVRAIAETAKALGVNPDGLGVLFKNEQMRHANTVRQRRNIAIMKAAGRGWNNKEIGQRYGLAENSVSRIIRQMLEKNPPATVGGSTDVQST